MTNYSRSVLKSNGLCHSKNLPVKFGFSLKTVPANIAQKLPPQVPSQTISHHDFQLRSQTPYVRFHRRKCVRTRLCSKDCTQRLTRRNRSLPSPGHSTVLSCQRNRHRKSSRRKRMHAYGVSASSGVAAPLGCVIFFCFCQNCGLHTMCSVLSACARRGVVSPLLVCSACCRNSRPPLVKTTNLPFSEIG